MQTNLITTTAVTAAYKSFSLYMLSHRKNVPNYQVASMSIIRYTKHTSRYTTLYAISVNQSQKIEIKFKNTNMFEGQLQLARSKTLSASTNLKRPETRSWDTLLMYVNPPTFISINPSVLLYLSFQPGWCKLLWLGVLYVWSRCQSGLVPALSFSLSQLEWGGCIARLSQEQGRLMDVSHPPTSTFTAYLPFPPLFCLYHNPSFSFDTEHYTFCEFSFFLFHTLLCTQQSFSTSAFNLYAFNYTVCHQLLHHYPLHRHIQSLTR